MNSTRWTIQVWLYKDAPIEFRRYGRDGDWFALVPQTFDSTPIPWCEGWTAHRQVGGWTVYVGPQRATETVSS
jgi:hypothetical protein